MNINLLKDDIEALFSVISKMAGVLGADENEMYEMCEAELAAFAMYISASDGRVRWEEASAISELFDLDLDASTVTDFIKKHNIYSVDFEQTPPEALKIAVAADTTLAQSGENPVFCSELIEIYKKVAACVACADGSGSNNEVQDTGIYISNMIEYIKNR